MSWANFGKLTALKINFAESHLASAAEIYGNKKNQVEVIINVELRDTADNALDVDELDIINALSLCDYETGLPLPSSWISSSTKGEYAKPIGYTPVVKSKHAPQKNVGNYVSLFISCDDSPSTRTIAVNINIPGVGPFNTSMGGTSTQNGPNGESGSVFKSPSQVTVKSVAPVDYSLPQSINVINRVDGVSSYSTDCTNIWVERDGASDNYNGKAAHQTVSTYIKTASTLQNHHFIASKNSVSRKNGSLSNLALVEKVDQSFSIPENGNAREWTCVFGLWVDRETIGSTSGGIQMMQEVTGINHATIYHTESKPLNYTADLPTDAVAVRTTKYDLTFSGLYRENWSLTQPTTSVSVTDNFGNTGSITIQLVNTGSSSIYNSYHPYLRVNGQ